MGTSTSNPAILPVAVPLVAGAVFFGWAFAATLEGCHRGNYEDAVDTWVFVGVATAVVYCILGAVLLARRLAGWLALVATALTLVGVALGAQAGYAIGMALAECEWDEGPALTLILFAIPGALFGYGMGWILRRAKA